LDGYWDNGVRLVLELLRKADKGRKKELYDATISLGIETVARGHSFRHLRQTFIDAAVVASETPFPDRVEGMFKGLAKEPAAYKCSVVPEGIKRHMAEHLPDDVKLRVGRPEKPKVGAEETFFSQIPKTGVYLSVEVRAADPDAARYRAEQRIGQVFAGLNLFNVDDHIGLKQTTVLVEDDGGVQTAVEYRRPGSQYLGSYESRQTKAEMLFRVQKRLSPADNAQISAAVQYHRLALLATSDEARLVNLWIALEALCQGGPGSIIERVCGRVSPCVSVDNVRRNLMSLALYVRFLWGDSDAKEFLAIFPGSRKDQLKPEDLQRVLLLPDRSPALLELCRLCAPHPLVLHRLFRTRSMTLDKPGSVADNLKTTRQNVDWQLKRIYRVRNGIVHRGQGSELIPQLVQHLHSYFVKTLRSVLVELDRQPTWTIRDALEHRRKLFEHVVQFFNNTPGHEISEQTLLNPTACLRPQAAPYLWPAPPAEPAVATSPNADPASGAGSDRGK
jgi:hypothetical protein